MSETIGKVEQLNNQGSILENIISKSEINSIEFTRNAKGEVAWKIKLYSMTGKESDTIDDLKRLDEKMMTLFK